MRDWTKIGGIGVVPGAVPKRSVARKLLPGVLSMVQLTWRVLKRFAAPKFSTWSLKNATASLSVLKVWLKLTSAPLMFTVIRVNPLPVHCGLSSAIFRSEPAKAAV